MKCAICGSEELRTLYRLPAGDILRCGACDTACRGNLVTEDDARELYEDDSYLDAPYFEALKVGTPRDVEPYLVYRRCLDRLSRDRQKGRLLDVGCSYGAFLEMARDDGWQAEGVEISAKATRYARSERDLEIFLGTLEEARYPDGRFDAITLWDVIEHLDDPLAMLRELDRILAPGGTIMLFTIHQKSLINRIGHLLYLASLGRFRKHLVLLYDIHHNFFFDERTLSAAIRRAGLTGPIAIDRMEANIDRWQNVPIPPLLAFGSRCLDVASRFVGKPYRMIFFVTKEGPVEPS